jgi:hypothetical protein
MPVRSERITSSSADLEAKWMCADTFCTIQLISMCPLPNFNVIALNLQALTVDSATKKKLRNLVLEATR